MYRRWNDFVCRVHGPTNQNKCCGKSGGGDQYNEVPLDFKVWGHIPPAPPFCSATIVLYSYTYVIYNNNNHHNNNHCKNLYLFFLFSFQFIILKYFNLPNGFTII